MLQIKNGRILLFCMPFLLIGTLNAEDFLNLTLNECLELGNKYNFDIKKSDYDRLSSQETTKQIKSQYEPSITLNANRADIESSGADPLYGTESTNDSLNITVNKKLQYSGGILSLEWSNEKNTTDSIFQSSEFQSINPLYDSNVILTYTQPLMKNFAGRNDKKAIEMSRLNEDIAHLSLDFQKNILSNKIEKAYLSLNFAKENLETQNKYLERAEKLLIINRAKFEDGLIEEVDIIANEAAITLREASILLAQDSVEAAEDNLKNLIGLPADKRCSFSEKLLTPFKHQEIKEEETIQKALSKRLDLRIIQNYMKINSIDNGVTKNAKLPSLDLTTQYGMSNAGESWNDNYDAIASGDNPAWYIGLSLTVYPLNKDAKSQMQQSIYTYEKSIADLEQQELNIVTECKVVTRKINTQALYVKAALTSLEMEREKLRLEEIKFNQGRSSIKWVLDYQDDLNRAQIEVHKALTDYAKATADLKLITEDSKGFR